MQNFRLIKLLFIYFIFALLPFSVQSQNVKLSKVVGELDSPWAITFINKFEVLITEKAGNIILFNLDTGSQKNIAHNLSILEDGQGGLLDILYKNGKVYVSYSENRGSGKSSTSIASSYFDENNLNFKTIFRAEPPINSGYHFGSRLVIKGDYLYASAGERGGGMIAQDPTKHPGSIIRIKLDGTVPSDNPRFQGLNNWRPEIYQIGVRNPQGMALSPFDGEIYMSNHGAKGGDWFGKVVKSGNYGWKILGWGGKNYWGTKIGPKWKSGFTKAIRYWVPSIAASAIAIYDGKEFPNWRGEALITSLKDESLRRLKFTKNRFLKETIIFKGNIGRIRDIEIDKVTGMVFLLSDAGEIWRMNKKLPIIK